MNLETYRAPASEGNWIQTFQVATGLTRTELAEALRIPESKVGAAERDPLSVDDDFVMRVVRAPGLVPILADQGNTLDEEEDALEKNAVTPANDSSSRLRRAREHAGLTQTELAQRLGT
jgi:hypothetical protein